MKTYWAVFTPRGRIVLETIAKSKKDAIALGEWEFCGWFEASYDYWEALEEEGFTVRKVTIKEEGK
jgi:hypothetical protein